MSICTFVILFCAHANGQTPAPLRRFIQKPVMQGASVSLLAKEVKSGEILYVYDSERKLIPASVTKTITTATALELLGKDFRFETSIAYDGHIANGVLEGNLFICGSGDPTLGSSEMKTAPDSIVALWASAVKKAGIRKINGKIIADESIFDTEGVSMKWLREDLGSGYGQGSYGINIFDNRFDLYLSTDVAGTKPTVLYCKPSIPSLKFQNYLTAQTIAADSFYITGFPYANERYLYGAVRAKHALLKIEGDIPDPPLFAAQYVGEYLKNHGVEIVGEPSCHRLLSQAGEWPSAAGRKILITTYSPTLDKISRTTNVVSHNMYADVLVKTLGLRRRPQPGETISSFERGTKVVAGHWEKKGLNTASLNLHDGSGLASTDKVTADFLCDLYVYMAKKSDVFDSFFESLPQAGVEGTVRSFLQGSSLQGNRLKSGSMSNVQCYGGYILKDGKQYAVVLMVNNFSGKNRIVRKSIEELFLSLF
jgi:D-alanyl-D-alanine carboxypeptidase/D-alanyl-D-alanine-endopeptidase (penicillin-binding protein 4)